MLKRYELSDCPVEVALTFMGDRYKDIILIELSTGTKRFSELKKASGISQRVLTAHLRFLEEYDVIERKVYAEVPPRVEYSLTELGESLKPVIDSMFEWGKNYQASVTKKE